MHGEFVHLDGVELDYVHQERRPKDIPIYIGATGMQLMELTGEIADGVVLNYLVSPDYIMKASGVPQSLLDEVGNVLTWPATHEQIVAAAKLVPDSIVQMICAAGTPDECRAKVAEYMANGCTSPILYPLGPDVRTMIDTFAGWEP